MKLLIQGLCLSMLFATTLAQAAGIDVDVFLLGGQSNARGVGVVAELPDRSIVYNERVMFYNASQWTSLQPHNGSHIGPEIGFGNRVAALHPDRSIAIIKRAVGGTDILSDWHPGVDANDTDHFGPQFQLFVQTVNAGINALIARGDTPVIRAMLWQQGERDARSEAAGTIYAENLSHLIHRFREQFNAPHMPFVYGQVLPVPLEGYPWRDQVRQGQLDVDEDAGHPFATDGARLVFADDLPMNSDKLHISAVGQLELGRRFADALKTVVVAHTVDFNLDSIVDSADINAMMAYWQQDESAYDVAPPPFGDGIVDALDLYIAFEHFSQDPLPIDPVQPFGMEAHWTFDETEGPTAHDSAGDHNGTLDSNPQWQPSMGRQGGALQFDGMDDFVLAPFVVNPGPRAFSVFAWVKGGAPGQVVLSQAGGMNWLLADHAAGGLRTDLTAPSTSGRGGIVIGPSLVGSRPITDGQWHSIGLVWDTTNRILYVDGHEVARDKISTIESAGGDLHIGAGAKLEADSFFAGLIDDVRIFKRAISAPEISSLAQSPASMSLFTGRDW